MSTKEVMWQHGRVLLILVIFTAAAVTLLYDGEFPKLKANDSLAENAITVNAIFVGNNASALHTLAKTPITTVFKNMLYVMVLVGLILAGYYSKLVLVGRLPKSPDEERLLQYIILARENGFDNADIMERLVTSGWEYGNVEKAIDTVQTIPSNNTNFKK